MDLRSYSKFLSYVLRHHPEEIGLTVDENGWAEISELISKSQNHGKSLDRKIIEQVIRQGSKQRFIISQDGQYIRAGYGHSVDVDLQMKPQSPPQQLYHGTAQKNAASILSDGIKARSRNFVHLSVTVDEARNVGGRHGTPIILAVLSKQMSSAGHDFYQSESEESIWLTSYVPPEFIEQI